MLASNPLARRGAASRLLVIAGALLLGACSQDLPPRSALELMRDPAVRDAVLLRCNQLQGSALRDAECRNVREAVDRLAAEAQQSEPEQVKQTDHSFEKAREARRAREEQERSLREASEKPVDPYTMPLVPEQPPAPAPTPTVAVTSGPPTPES
jgi:hypothetical protein